MSYFKKGLLAVLLTSVSASSFAQESPDIAAAVSDAASSFLGDFTTAAAAIGGVIIAAAFAAIIWKWIKGMIFS